MVAVIAGTVCELSGQYTRKVIGGNAPLGLRPHRWWKSFEAGAELSPPLGRSQ